MLEFLFPVQCMLCERAGEGLCPRCVALLQAPVAAHAPAGVDSLHAICSYEGAGRELVLALKRGNRRDGVALLGAALSEAIRTDTRAQVLAGVTWAPTTPERRRRRGYDQSQILAAAVARGLGSRASNRLARTGRAQMGLDVAHRRANPTFTARAERSREHRASPLERPGGSCTWVLVDDVVTTGATMSAAASVLRRAGATAVIGAVIAVTPGTHHGAS